MNNLKQIHLSLVLTLLVSACSVGVRTQTFPTTSSIPSTTSTIHPTETLLPTITPTLLPTRTPIQRATHSPVEATAWATSGCIKSFNVFAYYHKDPGQMARPEAIFPLPPWQLVTEIPILDPEGYSSGSSIEVIASRSGDGYQEIWVKEDFYSGYSEKSSKRIFLIYNPKTYEWEVVSAEIGDTDIFADRLFVMSDGSLWGQTDWDIIYKNFKLDKVPILSRFNERTRRFEFSPGVLEIERFNIPNNEGSSWPHVLLDSHSIFWIFTDHDGLYRYDPSAGTNEKQTDLPTFSITEAALSPDGSIYFKNYDERIFTNESLFHLADGMLFQFFPDTRKVVSLDIPDEPWPIFLGMLVDHNDWLWLGATGYRKSDGEWHMIQPNPQEYFEHPGDIYWSSPSLMLESSDGILWYQKFLDGDTSAEGTGWYDPQTGKGCMFTNLAAYIIEDSEQQLWLAVDGRLYKYILKGGSH